MKNLIFFGCFLISTLSYSVLAQEEFSDELLPVGQCFVIRQVNLRSDPSMRRDPLRLLKRNTTLTLLEPTVYKGYFRVITENGEDGWVWRKNVTTLSRLPSGAPNASSVNRNPRSVPCFDRLENCPEIGCAEEGSNQAYLNQMKRRIPEETEAIQLEFDDFLILQ